MALALSPRFPQNSAVFAIHFTTLFTTVLGAHKERYSESTVTFIIIQLSRIESYYT